MNEGISRKVFEKMIEAFPGTLRGISVKIKEEILALKKSGEISGQNP